MAIIITVMAVARPSFWLKFLIRISAMHVAETSDKSDPQAKGQTKVTG